MTLLTHLRIVGVIMAVLVVVNFFVPGRLRWREELTRVSLVNRQIFQVHTAFIILILAMFAALLLTSADALLEPTRLSRLILAGLTIFWGVRLLTQFFYYSPATWRGDRFNTAMHGIFSVAWLYVTAVLGAAFWSIAPH